MCVVSAITGDYMKSWPQPWHPGNPPSVPWTPTVPTPPGGFNLLGSDITRAEFDALKKEVEELKKLLIAAKFYDEATGQKDCEQEEKAKWMKDLGDFLGVDMTEVFG